uniref:Uncharacterized protein n=1 Tax=Hyaloperonospora arabidopsidis (strain Emoy2) TaxID=559515 RepID=M4BP91_HYAAE
MPATEDFVSALRPNGNDSDSDEAPDVVSNQNAMEEMLTQRREETAARAHAKAVIKRKRKSRQETEVLDLPNDVLLAIAAGKEEETREMMEKEEARRTKRREGIEDNVVRLMEEKKTHTRQFGNIYVQTLETLKMTKTREVSDNARQFLKLRTAPMRQRMNAMEGHSSLFTKKQKYRSQRR